MKSILPLVYLLGAAAASAIPITKGLAPNLTWTGEIHPGGALTTLTGTAKEIYSQIIDTNPSFETDLRRRHKEASHIRKRENPNPVSSDFTCDYGTLVNVTPIDAGIKDLYNIGTGTCSAPAGSTGNGGCTKLTCTDTASIWLCNDNDFAISVPCEYVADNAVELLIKCQTTTYTGTWDSTVRGQIFSGDGTWNVIINESSC